MGICAKRQRVTPFLFLVKPDASQDEVDDIIDSDGPPQVFAQSVSLFLFLLKNEC